MKNKVVKRVVFASLLALALPTLAVAASPSQIDRLKMSVSYDGLDIHSDAGAKILYTRIKRASDRACGVASLNELGSIKRVSAARKCAAYMVEKAVKQIDSDELKKVHRS